MKSLIAQRIVRVSQSSSPIPKMTDEAWEILHGERSFFTPKFQTAILENRLPLRNDPPVPGLSPFANRVFHALKHSQEKAILSGLIPYSLLFSRRNLADIAIHLPSDEKSFLKIHGCGKRKYAAQGEAFLDIIRRLCENSPEEAENSRVPFTTSHSEHREQSVTELSTYEETLKCLHQGKSIEEIADERILSPRTIVIHVGKLMKQGHDFQTERFFTPERFRQIKEWFRIAYDGHAKSVVYASEGQLDYSEALLASYFIDKANKSQEYFRQAIDEACKIEDTIMRDDVFRHIAMRLSRVGQRKEAETLRRKIQTTVKDDPQCSELNYIIGLLNEQDFDKAVSIAQSISKNEPVRAHSLALVAKTLYRAGQTERSTQILDDLVAEVKPDDNRDDTLPQVIETLVELDLFERIENLIDRLPRLDDRMRTCLHIADRHLLHNGPDASVPYLDRAFEYAKMFDKELGVETGSKATIASRYARYRFSDEPRRLRPKFRMFPLKSKHWSGLRFKCVISTMSKRWDHLVRRSN